jgi:hypothetical protein
MFKDLFPDQAKALRGALEHDQEHIGRIMYELACDYYKGNHAAFVMAMNQFVADTIEQATVSNILRMIEEEQQIHEKIRDSANSPPNTVPIVASHAGAQVGVCKSLRSRLGKAYNVDVGIEEWLQNHLCYCGHAKFMHHSSTESCKFVWKLGERPFHCPCQRFTRFDKAVEHVGENMYPSSYRRECANCEYYVVRPHTGTTTANNKWCRLGPPRVIRSKTTVKGWHVDWPNTLPTDSCNYFEWPLRKKHDST